MFTSIIHNVIVHIRLRKCRQYNAEFFFLQLLSIRYENDMAMKLKLNLISSLLISQMTKLRVETLFFSCVEITEEILK